MSTNQEIGWFVQAKSAVASYHPRPLLKQEGRFLTLGFRLHHETLTALLLAATLFTLLASYYVLKTVREALILSEAGAAVKSYSAAGQALLLLAVIPAYAFVASRVNRSRLIAGVTLFFISHLAIF